MTDRLYSLADAADAVDMTPDNLRKLCQQGKVKAFKQVGGWHIRQSVLDKVVRQRQRRKS